MNETSDQNHYVSLPRLKLFFALSRTPHGLLDMATPALCALLWLGDFPPLKIILLGLLTTFAGYTAVYALNDVIDYRTDKEKNQQGRLNNPDNYLDAVLVHHPMAQGLMSLKEGVLWLLAWALIAVIGAYQLNPICVVIFLCGCALEIVYCLMLKISHLRTLVSGAVKTTGSMAAIFAVDPNPSYQFLTVLFLWLFFWEIGGQNIPADWTDIDEDKRFQAKTIPVRFGVKWAGAIILGAIILAILLNVVLLARAQGGSELPHVIACFLAGIYLLVLPTIQLLRTREPSLAIKLFNKASFYPLALLVITAANIVI